MKQKVLALILAMTTVSGLLAGCGSQEASSGNATENAAGTATGSETSSDAATDQTGDVPTIKIAYNIMFPATDEVAIE